MRAWPLWVTSIALVVSVLACDPSSELPADADVCKRANHLFSSCGVVLPTLANAPCTGAAKLVARCVVDHGATCDGLATLTQRLDACVEDQLDGGDLLPPPVDLPVPLADPPSSEDAGKRDASEAARELRRPPSPYSGSQSEATNEEVIS
jgi:hypothetical protein